ncbi:heat shock factor protein 5 [Pterocles gutturalis]
MEEPPLPTGINPNYFPAKLWRLVNNPLFRSVRWDGCGEVLLVDQPLFEREVLGAGPGGGADLDFFQTKSFGSFIRQLNLYGFHKVPAGGEAGPDHGVGVGDGFGGPLLCYHNPNFRRDRPDLLGRLVRLTSGNKAKLAAGQVVTSRPANQDQVLQVPGLRQLLSPSRLVLSGRPGLMTVGQLHQPYRQGSFFPYFYIPTSTQKHGTLVTECSDQTPVPSRMCQSSLGLLPGHEASPAFPDRRIGFPVLQRFPPEVTCTLQTVASLVPLQQASQTITASFPTYSSYVPPVQYSQAYYPTSALQCYSTPAHMDPLTSCAGPAAPVYTHCSFFQNPPRQSPYTAEFLPSNWPYNTSEENKKTEVNLEAVFQMADELYSLPKAEALKVEPMESQCSIHQCNRGQPLVNSENIVYLCEG